MNPNRPIFDKYVIAYEDDLNEIYILIGIMNDTANYASFGDNGSLAMNIKFKGEIIELMYKSTDEDVIYANPKEFLGFLGWIYRNEEHGIYLGLTNE